MKRIALATALLLTSLAAAHAFGLGREGFVFGRLGLISSKKASAGGSSFILADTGSALLVNTGSKFLIQ